MVGLAPDCRTILLFLDGVVVVLVEVVEVVFVVIVAIGLPPGPVG